MSLRMTSDAHGRLTLHLPDGEPIVDVVPVRCFPLTEPGRLVAFVDGRGRERFCLEDPSRLDEASRRLLAAELERREFVPVIIRVCEVRPRSEPSTWEVETDRGPASFVLPSEDNVRRLGAESALVTDGAGVRWRLEAISRMDGRSRAILRRYL